MKNLVLSATGYLKAMIRKLFLKLFVLTFSFFISLLIAEGIFRLLSNVTRVYYPATWTSPAIFVESEEGYSLLPNQKAKHYSLCGDYIVDYTTNSQGIRSKREYLKDKPKNTKRIFILGDSLAFGIGVNDDETLASVLEEKLNEQSQENIHYEGINLGVTGYTFDSSYVRMKRYFELNPDLIIFVVLGINDFLDIVDHEWVLDKNQDIVALKENFRHVDQYNRLVNGPKSLYKKNSFIVENLREFLRRNSVMYAFFGTLRYRNKLRTVELETRRKNIEVEMEGVSRSIKVLDRFFDLVDKNQIKTLFILEGFYNKPVKDRFLKYLAKKTNWIIDMDDLNKIRDSYILRDGHWSVLGNSYIADLVFKYLKDNHIL